MTVLLIIGSILIVVALLIIVIYNSLVKNRNLVEEAWSVINVMLKKRYDLIPNLVEIVKGYASHEKETFENIVHARNQAYNSKDMAGKEIAEKNLQHAMMNLFALAESYPDLKANSNFQQLQSELTTVENDMEKSRRYYNGTVRAYNIKIESFPSNMVANIFNFQKSNFFELDNPLEKQVPQIKF